ncbi:MAG: hypothetical protein KIG65_05055 [Eubacteriales bacterium]|nr:hypothetical protein [Eubacteriales bacterium]
MKFRIMSLILCFVLAFSLLIPSVCYADYGSTIPANASGNRTDIITIKRPESLSASTSDKTYTISATGAQGTKIKIYKLDKSADIGRLASSVRSIGASGLYSCVVDLNNDSNTFIVYAQNDSGSQVVNITINKIKKSTIDRLKSLTVTIKSFLG